MKQYSIDVFTGNRQHASTEANVFMEMFGTLGASGELLLEHSNRKKKFQRGQKDRFHFDVSDLGRLTKIIIGHDRADATSSLLGKSTACWSFHISP
jgi:hypothetical protein